MSITAKVTAVGGHVPEYVLTNAELETMVDTNDQWIRERTGIAERRILKGERGSSAMAIEAFWAMQAQYDIDPAEIDLIICATVTPDMQFPATANKISLEIGANRAFGFDLEAACSSYLYALSVGAQFIETGKLKKVLVVGTDKMSSIVDYTDRSTCIIFGDGAGCVLLEPDTEGFGLLDGVYYSDGAGIQHLHQVAGGSIRPASEETVRNKAHFIYQEGRPVFKQAVVRMAEAALEVMERNALTADDIQWLVPHQANKRIIDVTANRAGLPEEKVMLNIQRYGNTTSGTLPLCLWDYREQLNKGDNLILATFGGGFTWGASWLKWGL